MRDKKLVDHYEVLGIARDATLDQIKKAWSKLQTLYHPDKNHGQPEHLVKLAEEKLKDINAAKEVLLDPDKRAELDRLLHESERGSAPAKPAFVPESIDFGLIKAGETRRAHLDIQNLGGPPTNPPDLDLSPDCDWFEVAQVAPSHPRFWFGLEVTATNTSDSGAAGGSSTGWISITVDGATARATMSGFFEPNSNNRLFSVHAVACELVDSDSFLYETPTGGAHEWAGSLSGLIRLLAEYSCYDLYPRDSVIENFRYYREEFREELRVMGATKEAGRRFDGYDIYDRPMQEGRRRFFATGDAPKVEAIDSTFSEITAIATVTALATELAKILSVESKQVWAAILYLHATARLIAAGASRDRMEDPPFFINLLRVIREARAEYGAANELALSDGIRKAIELTERLEQEALEALSQVEKKRSQWLRSIHKCIECEKALGWGERLAGADRHSDCAAKSGAAADGSGPQWGRIGAAAAGLLFLAAVFGMFDAKPDHVNLPIVHNGTAPPAENSMQQQQALEQAQRESENRRQIEEQLSVAKENARQQDERLRLAEGTTKGSLNSFCANILQSCPRTSSAWRGNECISVRTTHDSHCINSCAQQVGTNSINSFTFRACIKTTCEEEVVWLRKNGISASYLEEPDRTIGPAGCIGLRTDQGAVPEGAECLRRFLGEGYFVSPEACSHDGYAYNVRLRKAGIDSTPVENVTN